MAENALTTAEIRKRKKRRKRKRAQAAADKAALEGAQGWGASGPLVLVVAAVVGGAIFISMRQ